MKVLIAGSKSFVGKNFLVPNFAHNSIDLIPLDRSLIDLTSPNELRDFVIKTKPDVIVHSAVSLNDSINNLKMYYALESVADLVSKIIMIGSGCEYSHQRYIPMMPEEYFSPLIPPNNNDSYHNSKFTISRLHENSSLSNIYNFRVFGLYGMHEDYHRRLISNNIYQFIKNGTMSFNKDISFDYIYVKDLIDSIYHFCSFSKKPNHRTYNVCKGIGEKFSYILSQVMIGLGGNVSKIICKDLEPSDYNYSGCSKRFESEFSFKIAKTSFQDTAYPIKNWIISDMNKQKNL